MQENKELGDIADGILQFLEDIDDSNLNANGILLKEKLLQRKNDRPREDGPVTHILEEQNKRKNVNLETKP